MAFRIVGLLNVFGEDRFFIQKRYKFLFFRIWITVRNYKFPIPHKLYFQSKRDAKEFMSKSTFVPDMHPTLN
jgi:hypothetical protein